MSPFNSLFHGVTSTSFLGIESAFNSENQEPHRSVKFRIVAMQAFSSPVKSHRSLAYICDLRIKQISLVFKISMERAVDTCINYLLLL